jgi:3,4-dihydroxyphenylacetate 2,3-dioxygenase
MVVSVELRERNAHAVYCTRGRMNGGIVGAALATHSPRMAAQEPDWMGALLNGARAMGEQVRAARPDVLVVQSAHWQTTFQWYVTCQAQHAGRCVATEAPDLIPGTPYRRRGDPELGRAIAEEATGALQPFGGLCARNETADFVWDYGSLVPLLYMDPDATLPVVLLSTCMAATLEECLAMGAGLRRAAERTGRRLLFVASGALSHALTRSPQDWPTPPRRELDQRFVQLLTAGDVPALRAWLPAFARDSVAEVGGRHLATMLGVLDGLPGRLRGEVFGYGQSSGSGNANVLVQPTA